MAEDCVRVHLPNKTCCALTISYLQASVTCDADGSYHMLDCTRKDLLFLLDIYNWIPGFTVLFSDKRYAPIDEMLREWDDHIEQQFESEGVFLVKNRNYRPRCDVREGRLGATACFSHARKERTRRGPHPHGTRSVA